jgi:hypothetical protein
VNLQIKKASRGPLVTAVSYSSKNKCSPLKTETNEYVLALITDAAEAHKAVQQMAKVGATYESHLPINPSGAHAGGIPVELD